jgi:hypothetical protein
MLQNRHEGLLPEKGPRTGDAVRQGIGDVVLSTATATLGWCDTYAALFPRRRVDRFTVYNQQHMEAEEAAQMQSLIQYILEDVELDKPQRCDLS